MSERDSWQDPLRPRTSVPLADITPFYEDRVLIKRLPWPFEPSSTLAAPETATARKTGLQYGEVVSIGGGNTRKQRLVDVRGVPYFKTLRRHAPHPMNVKPGDKVLYHREPSQEFVVDGETMTFVHEEQRIEAVLE